MSSTMLRTIATLSLLSTAMAAGTKTGLELKCSYLKTCLETKASLPVCQAAVNFPSDFEPTVVCSGIQVSSHPLTCADYEECLAGAANLPCEICRPIFAPTVGECGLCIPQDPCEELDSCLAAYPCPLCAGALDDLTQCEDVISSTPSCSDLWTPTKVQSPPPAKAQFKNKNFAANNNVDYSTASTNTYVNCAEVLSCITLIGIDLCGDLFGMSSLIMCGFLDAPPSPPPPVISLLCPPPSPPPPSPPEFFALCEDKMLVTVSEDNTTFDGLTYLEGKNMPMDTPLCIVGTKLADTITGANGDDIIFGREGGDIIAGGDGEDTIYGDGGSDSLVGGTGNDIIYGERGQDTIRGNGGADTLYGDSNEDLILGNADDDVLYGGSSADVIYGGGGDDALYGQDGKDTLRGDGGSNKIIP